MKIYPEHEFASDNRFVYLDSDKKLGVDFYYYRSKENPFEVSSITVEGNEPNEYGSMTLIDFSLASHEVLENKAFVKGQLLCYAYERRRLYKEM
jgi:hypothetical protein